MTNFSSIQSKSLSSVRNKQHSLYVHRGLAICFSLGRRPFKQLPTDELFAASLLETLILAFDYSVPKNVLADLMDDEYSRVINLRTGFVTDYAGYLKKKNKKKAVTNGKHC